MQITKEIVGAILKMHDRGEITYGEIGRHINMTSQNVGRFMSGQVRTINDASGELLLQMLGMKETPQADINHILEITCTSNAMEPIVGKGQRLFAQTSHCNEIASQSLVVISFSDVEKDNKERIVCRYFTKFRRSITLKAERGDLIKTTVGRINWVARVINPSRRVVCK